MADPFISEADVVELLGRGDPSDPGLTIAVTSACDIVRDAAGQVFTAVPQDSVTLDGTDTDALPLPERPVTTIRTVSVEGTAVDDYTVNDNGILFRGTVTGDGSTWPRGRQNVTVVYDHGYADGEVPASVRMVALGLASRLWVQGVAVSESIGQSSVTYGGPASELTKTELLILSKYRQIRS